MHPCYPHPHQAFQSMVIDLTPNTGLTPCQFQPAPAHAIAPLSVQKPKEKAPGQVSLRYP